MPLYAYRCTQCGHRFEKIQSFSSQLELVCPVCQGVLERPLTAPRLHFKGAGWYVNDYAAKSSAPAAESGSESASESGSESGKTVAPAETKSPATAGDSTSNSSTATPAPAPAPATTPSTPTS